jgi:hypothetical protein
VHVAPSAPHARRLAAAALGGLSLAALTGCGPHAAPTAVRYRGTALPTRAGPVRVQAPAYRGPAAALYASAARYFRWPLLVPATLPRGASAVSAMVSRLFAGTFAIDANGRASQVPNSYVPGTPVAPAAYQLRVTYLVRGRPLVLFEAVHAYASPAGARALSLPGGVADGRTWVATPAPQAAPLRYVEGRRDGLYLMVYGPARVFPAARLAGWLADLAAVPVPPGKAPAARVAAGARP